MHVAYWIAGAIIAAMMLWIASQKRRRAEDLPLLLQSIGVDMWERLSAAGFDSDWNDEELWRTVGGWQGLKRVWRDTGLLVSVFLILAMQFPEEAGEASREAWWSALYLRFFFVGAIIESAVRMAVPIPRMQMQAYIRLYCSLHASLDVLVSECSPRIKTA